MRYIVRIPQIPPTVNKMFYTFNRRRVLTEEHRRFRRLVESIIGGRRIPSDWEFVKVDLYLTPVKRFKMDGDNFFKSTFDALTKAGFWTDDSQVATASFHFTAPSKEPETTLVIERAPIKFNPDLTIDERDATVLECGNLRKFAR